MYGVDTKTIWTIRSALSNPRHQTGLRTVATNDNPGQRMIHRQSRSSMLRKSPTKCGLIPTFRKRLIIYMLLEYIIFYRTFLVCFNVGFTFFSLANIRISGHLCRLSMRNMRFYTFGVATSVYSYWSSSKGLLTVATNDKGLLIRTIPSSNQTRQWKIHNWWFSQLETFILFTGISHLAMFDYRRVYIL